MPYEQKEVSATVRILFPIVTTMIVGILAPRSVALVGFLMFGNLLRECKVLRILSESAQKELANLVTILLGITIASKMRYDLFVKVDTLVIILLGLVAFVFDTIGGVLFAKLLNLFVKKKINPMVGAAGISAFPMSSRVVHKMGLKEDPTNFLLMHAAGANVAGQIASVVAGGVMIALVEKLI
jgi:oxaloacetate decarboxylase beta subunit